MGGPFSTACINCGATSCGAVGAACLSDAVCVRCVQDDFRAPECRMNTAFVNLARCGCNSCASDCAALCAVVP